MNIATADHATAMTHAAAQEAAFLALMDALACSFLALQQPACARLLGPLVPGATMAFGARVPGTSYQLDPVHAAFNIGTMISWLGANDPGCATPHGFFSDTLGAIIAVGDYRARKLIAEGSAPVTVRDMQLALIAACHRVAMEEARWSAASAPEPGASASSPPRSSSAMRCALVCIASAEATMSLMGGLPDQVQAAIELARNDQPWVSTASSSCSWRLGDATSRGVRLALIARADAAPAGPQHTRVGRPVDDALSHERCGAVSDRLWPTAAAEPATGHRIRERFTAAVVGHFPAVQAGKILALFDDQGRLEALPVNQLVSMTVRN